MLEDLKVAAIDRAFNRRVEVYNLPALAVAIVQDGEVVYRRAEGCANLEFGAPATSATMFQLASVTKLLTAALLMRLVDDGMLGLEQAVSDHIPDLPPSWRAITVGQLANHSSGLPSGMVGGGVAPALAGDQVRTAADVVRVASEMPLSGEPGRISEYGLVDYAVLTEVMERATSRKFPELLETRVARPLGLTVTFDHAVERGMARIADVIPQRASTYFWDGAKQKRMDVIYPRWGYSAGGLFGSLDALVAFVTGLDKGFLSAGALEAMWRSSGVAGPPPAPFAIGWIPGEFKGVATVGHSGGPALADLLRAPSEKLTVIALCNQMAAPPQMARDVLSIVLGESP